MIPEGITKHLFNDFAVGDLNFDTPVHYLDQDSKRLLPYCINSGLYVSTDISIV